MAMDNILSHVGDFGVYQQRIFLLLSLPVIFNTIHIISGTFLGFTPKFRCFSAGTSLDVNKALFYDWNNLSDPTINTCYIVTDRVSHLEEKICNNFIFDPQIVQSSIVTEWNLVCDKQWMKTASDSMFMAGVMIGSMVLGGLSDKYGRKAIIFSSLVAQLIAGMLAAVSPNYITYVLSKFIIGITFGGAFVVTYVMAMEMTRPSKRRFIGIGIQFVFTLGYISFGALAYFIRNWRILQISITLPNIVFIFFWWSIPESTRWLLLKGKVEEACTILRKAAKENGNELSKEMLDHLVNEKKTITSDKFLTVTLIFRYPNLRRKMILLFILWIVIIGTYYGLSWNASTLSGNNYMNHILSGLVEIPAHTFVFLTLERWGRKGILCGSMLLTSIALFSSAFISKNPVGVVVFFMIGKMSITASLETIYLFSAELLPTVIRNTGLGACSTMGRIGSILASLIVNEFSAISPKLALFIFGIAAFSGAFISMFLPETLNKKLPESMDDGEKFPGSSIS